ncbi:carboxy terminal-processing peptidase [Flavobacterium sp. SM2513]|uniref:carboxy terminal-processing peptidase n=1 Tax=Flavobacterium sp. SM2513 TaxID=3424766 RepID=UPI003D7F96AF
MKNLAFAFLVLPSLLFAQKSENVCQTISKVSAVIEKNHFQPKPIDDSLSVFVFENLMDELDSGRNIFSKTDFENLSKHRLLLDNYISEKQCGFIDEFIFTYRNALQRKRTVLTKLQLATFDYNTKDSVRFTRQKIAFDVESNAFEKVWTKLIRYDILEDISKLSTNSDSLYKNFNTLEKIAKKKILDSNLCKVNALLENDFQVKEKVKTDFLNAFCTYFDPHSNYFSAESKSNFMSGLSVSNLSLGIEVSLNENEEIVIQEIVPGGPASKNPKIEIDDIITKVSTNNGTEYEVSCSSLETIGDLIFSDTNTEIGLTLRKINGTTLTVLLKKKVMKSTNNAVYSFVVEKDIKVGYIKIPNFYSDFEHNTVKGCADDVAKEIIKLKKDNIEGLVIDLQNNGGGSMAEAIKLAGMFINIGPVSVLVNQFHNQNILKDFNRGVVYDGPMIILMNGNSASASEFFAAALQDYNRALIVGSTSLGKASMQAILPLEENNTKDFLKLTIEKFYRISGDSHQIKGIIPDVFMPILFDSLIKRENSFASALPYDVIKTNTRFTALSKIFDEQVLTSSKNRIENNTRFKSIKNINQEINAVYNSQRKPIRLRFPEVFEATHETDKLWENVKILTTEETECTIKNNSYDLQKLAYDEFKKEINAFKIKDVKSNPYIEEAVNIINDYKKTKL